MGSRDISHLPLAEIYEMCKKYLRRLSKTCKIIQDPIFRATKSASREVTIAEFGSLFEYFKTYFLGTISSQLDTLKIKKKREEENNVLSIFYSRCRQKHPLCEFPLNNI